MKKLLSALLLFPSLAWAAAPTVVSSEGTTAAASGSHAVNIPGDGCLSSQALIAIVGSSAATEDIGFPDGWAEIVTRGTNSEAISVGYFECTGSEGATFTVTFSVGGASSTLNAVVLKISGHDTAIDAEATATGGAAATDLDPPSLTPTGGSKDYLWITAALQDDQSAVTSCPTNYTTNCASQDTGDDDANHSTMAWSWRANTASSEDPGVFVFADSDTWDAVTIAVHPATATLPTFTSGPTIGTITQTTFPFTFTLDQTGTVYGVVCPDGQTFPTVAQVKAGDCTGDVDAVSAFSEAVVATVGDSNTFTGLSAGTQYDVHFAATGTGGDTAAISTVANQTTSSGSSFPQIVTASVSANDTNQIDQVVTLPSSLVGGNLLLCILSIDGAITASWPDGWIELFDANRTGVSLSAGYRIITGAEGGSITVAASASEKSSHRCYQISQHDSTNLPQGGTANGVSGNPDPPNLTPAGGAKNYLWIAVAAIQPGTNVATGFPSGYGNTGQENGAGDTIQSPIAWATRELNASSENPGSFTATSSNWVAATIAIHPGTTIAAPSFTSGPTAGTVTSTTLQFSYTTDTTGTVKGVACPDGQTFPTVTQVLNGNCTGDVAAEAAISDAVTANTPADDTFTGLTASTTYDVHFAIDASTDSAAISTVANQTTAGASNPTFDTNPFVSARTTDTYTISYNTDGAGNFFVGAYLKDSPDPTCDNIEAQTGTGFVVRATEAATNNADTIDLAISGGDPFPVYDLHACAEDSGGSNDSAVIRLYDEALDVPTGRQYVTKSGAPTGGQLGLLDGASPASANGDIMDVSAMTTSGAIGPDAHNFTVNADTTYSVNTVGDLTRQTVTRRFYDVSAGAWSDSSPILYCINNVTATYLGPDGWEGEIPYLFERGVATSYLLDRVWDHPLGDDLTHNILNIPAGLSEDGEELSGTPTTFGYYPTVTLEATDPCGDTAQEVVQFVVGFRIPDFTAWLEDETLWKSASIFAANDPDFNVPLPRVVGW